MVPFCVFLQISSLSFAGSIVASKWGKSQYLRPEWLESSAPDGSISTVALRFTSVKKSCLKQNVTSLRQHSLAGLRCTGLISEFLFPILKSCAGHVKQKTGGSSKCSSLTELICRIVTGFSNNFFDIVFIPCSEWSHSIARCSP